MPLQNFTDLDFDQIKITLTDYIKANSDFTDYDFEGSNLSTIINVLAYNTYITSYNANMVSNEVFIDSATLRENVVALARNIGYLPRSKKASRTDINFFVNTDNISPTPSTLVLKKGTVVTTGNQFGSQSYTFGITEDKTVSVIDGVASFTNLTVFEGTIVTQSFNVTANNPSQRFILPNNGIDLDTLTVTVKPSAISSVSVTYNRQDDLFDPDNGTTINKDSTIYFVQEIEDEQYEIFFGDDVFGKALNDGDSIEVSYIISSGDSGNGVSNFNFSGRLVYNTNAVEYNVTSGISLVTSNTPSSGGEQIESVESIKKYAPQIYATQNRALTANDYEILIPNRIFTETESISVFGGEDLVPPQFGKVFISIKPRNGDFVPNSIKENIKRNLKKYSVAGIVPEILDLKYLFLETASKVYYNPSLSPTSSYSATRVHDNIVKYGESSELNKYGARFKYSKFLNIIDQSDQSITSNITTLQMRRDLRLAIGSFAEYAVDFGNKFHISSLSGYNIKSSSFRVSNISGDVYLFDTPIDEKTGKIGLFSLETPRSTNPIVKRTNIGSINYQTGRIVLNPLNIVSGKTKDNVQILEISGVPDSNDVIGIRDLYLQLDRSDIEMIVDEISSGANPSGSTYNVNTSYNTGSIVRN